MERLSTAGSAVPEGNATLGQIVGLQLQGDFVAGEHADVVAAQSSGQVRENDALMFELNTKKSARKLFQNGTGYFDAVLFTHKPRFLRS